MTNWEKIWEQELDASKDWTPEQARNSLLDDNCFYNEEDTQMYIECLEFFGLHYKSVHCMETCKITGEISGFWTLEEKFVIL